MNLTVNLITRGRPDRLVKTLDGTLPLLEDPATTFVVSVDEDDQATLDVLYSFDRIVVDCRPREDALGSKWNRGLDYPADVYFGLADYNPVLTQGFDRKILEAASLFPDGIGVVYSNMANFSFPTGQGVTHGLVEKLGWMYPPLFPYWFVDHWIDDIAKLIDRISFADVQVNFIDAKPPTQESRELGFWATFYDMMRLMRRAQARSIIDSDDFQEPEWRKEILRRHYPLHEYRSQWINNHVRDMPQGAHVSGGERYDRLRAQAVEMMQAAWPALEKELRAA